MYSATRIGRPNGAHSLGCLLACGAAVGFRRCEPKIFARADKLAEKNKTLDILSNGTVPATASYVYQHASIRGEMTPLLQSECGRAGGAKA